MGLLDFPKYDKVGGIIALLLAIFLNGLGILIWGLVKGEKNTMLQGAIILILVVAGWFIAGILGTLAWVLAIIWGIMVLIKSL